MAGLPEEVRRVTDALDSVGNSMAAVTKGFDISAAALTALSSLPPTPVQAPKPSTCSRPT